MIKLQIVRGKYKSFNHYRLWWLLGTAHLRLRQSDTLQTFDEEMYYYRRKSIMRMDMTKIYALWNWAAPKLFILVWSFMGLTSFYTKFIPYFGAITTLIKDCRLRMGHFGWSNETKMSFKRLKQLWGSTPIFAFVQFLIKFWR